MKKLCSFSLAIILIISFPYAFSSCSPKLDLEPDLEPDWEPYLDAELEVIYQAEGYTPTTQYLLTLRHRKPEDELIPFFDIYLNHPYYYEYVIIHPDLSMVYTGQEPSDKETESFIKMTSMSSGSYEGSKNNWNWNRHLNLARIEELQASKDADDTWIISQYAAFDTGYYVIFCQKDKTNAPPNFLAEVALDGKILRIFSLRNLHSWDQSIIRIKNN